MFRPKPKGGLKPKKEKAPLKRVAIKKKQSRDGMLKFFIEIWMGRLPGDQFEKREYTSVEDWRQHTSQYRVCCVTYETLHYPVAGSFMHVLTKGHTKWKKNPDNICLGLYRTHQIQEFEGEQKLIEHGEGGKWFIEYKNKLKSEYEKQG